MAVRLAMSNRALLLALVLTVACRSDDQGLEIPPIVWSGEHLDYAPAEDLEVCSGTLPYMDHFVSLAAAEMDIEIDGRLVYVYGSQEVDACKEYGCSFDDGTIYARGLPFEHELVHGVRGFAGSSHSFFEEGAAEMLGGVSSGPGGSVPAGTLLEGIELSSGHRRLPFSWYPRAAGFAAYLHGRGSDLTEALLWSTDKDTSAKAAVDVLEAAAGLPFDDLVADYENGPDCEVAAQYRYPLYACDTPEVLRLRCDGELAVRIVERIACDDPTTLGPRDGEIWKYIAFDVLVAGRYTFNRTSDQEAGSIAVRECVHGCGAATFSGPIYANTDGFFGDMSVFLPPGRYAIRISRPEDSPGIVTVWIEGDDCD
jgi:hypothetical protein